MGLELTLKRSQHTKLIPPATPARIHTRSLSVMSPVLLPTSYTVPKFKITDYKYKES